MDAWIANLIEGAGLLGVAALMFLENIVLPIPSEIVMPLAGYAAATGTLPLVPTILAGAVGSLAGASVWFAVARWFGEERLRRWADRFGRILTLTEGDIDQADAWFRRRARTAVLVGRLIPAVRVVISIPAGLAGMSWTRFLVFSFLGTLLWTGALMLAGYWLGSQSDAVGRWVSPISIAIVVACVAIYVVRIVTYPRRKRREAERRAGRPVTRQASA